MSMSAVSLSDAEAREDAVEQVVGVNRASHFSQLIERGTEGGGRELRGVSSQDVGAGGAKVIGAHRDVMPATALARGECRPGESRDAIGQDCAHRLGPGG